MQADLALYNGTITPGKLADLVVLPHDIFAIPPMSILETEVEATLLNGQFVYCREEFL